MIEEKRNEKFSTLVKQENYLEAGTHIGTKLCTFDMKRFVFKTRNDGLNVLDLKQMDMRLREAAKIICKYNAEDVLIVASRTYSGNAAEKLAALTGINVMRKRFVPGTMTNIALSDFKEPKLIFISDPRNEREAIIEAVKMGIPVIGLCDTDNETKNLDYIIPANNKGRKSLALIFYILTREIVMAQNKISSYDQFQYEPNYFEKFDELEKIKDDEQRIQEPTKPIAESQEPQKPQESGQIILSTEISQIL
ncbi:MAG: 30S ribosomal protein S2 [Candidatus Micrarchaeota archaeon]